MHSVAETRQMVIAREPSIVGREFEFFSITDHQSHASSKTRNIKKNPKWEAITLCTRK
jgi:hypothetical protein